MNSLYSSRAPRMVRRGSEHSLLSCSMVVGPGSAPEKQTKEKKSKTLEKPKSKRKTKKSDTFSGRGTPTSSSVLSSPVRNSSTMYFGSSPSHTGSLSLRASASFSAADIQLKTTPKKASKWSKISNIMNKKLNRATSTGMDADDSQLRTKPRRSQSIPSIKKCGIYNGRNASIGGEEMGMGLCESGSISSTIPRTRTRKSSASQANSVNLIAKIFSVLRCWVEEYYEVSAEILCSSLGLASYTEVRWPLLLTPRLYRGGSFMHWNPSIGQGASYYCSS